MVDPTPVPPLVGWVQRLENSAALDAPVKLIEPLVGALLSDKRRADLLHGMWLGHAVHPLLVIVPIGSWTSATVLDLTGGADARSAAQRLVATGLLAAGPAAITGWAEWGPAGGREKRVGVVHAASNVTAVGFFAASWRARNGGRHLRGVVLGLAGHAAVGLGGYLGGHLTEARKVGSHHPAFDQPRGATV